MTGLEIHIDLQGLGQSFHTRRGSGYKIQCFNFKIQCSADQRGDRTLASVSRENYIGDFEPDRIFGSTDSIYLKILSCA